MKTIGLNTNMRSLKRIPGPNERLIYTLENRAEQNNSKILCDHCGAKTAAAGFPACKTREAIQQNSHKGIKLLIRACPDFEPLLTFRPPLRGFEGEFNTFRLGTAWYYRIGPGVKASLVDTSTNQVFGKAEVIEAIVGPLAEMCGEHAMNNHAMLGIAPELAAEKMKKLIRQSYGMVEMDESSEVTVIYLRNLSAADGELERKT
jgi:hypothetical protein